MHERLWHAVTGYPEGDATREEVEKDGMALAAMSLTLDVLL